MSLETYFEVCLEVCLMLKAPGAYILGVSLGRVFSSMFSVKWKYMSVQVVRHVHTWWRERIVTSR